MTFTAPIPLSYVVIPVNRFENPTAEQIVNEEDVQNIVNSIKIN